MFAIKEPSLRILLQLYTSMPSLTTESANAAMLRLITLKHRLNIRNTLAAWR